MRDFLCIFIIINDVLFLNFICASTPRVRRESMKVQISATGDTIVLKFVRPHMDTKLQGYILGYGSSMFSKQFIKLPENGEHYETEIDAEPKYLISVKQVKSNEVKKECTEKVTLEKPLHMVIGSVTPTSVLLSWGTLLKTPYTDTNLEDCIEDSQFLVRYRETEPSKQWNYQTCPTTSTVVENLKPDTPYEFGVRADTDTIRGAWSSPVVHNTADIHIHTLLNPEKLLILLTPTVKAPQDLTTFDVRHNITLNTQAPFMMHTRLSSIPTKSPGTGNALFQVPTGEPSSRTTNTIPPQKSTSSPLSRTTKQHYHTTQSTTSTTENQATEIQLSTTKTQARTETQPSTTKTQLSKIISLPSITISQPSITEFFSSKTNNQMTTIHPETSEIHSTIQPTTNQIQPINHSQMSTTQRKPSTVQLHVRTIQSKLETTTQMPSSTKYRTTQSQTITNQPHPRKSLTISSTAQPLTSTIQQQTQTNPNLITEQATLQQSQTYKPQPIKIKQLTTSQQDLYVSKQTSTFVSQKSPHTSNTYFKFTQQQQTLSTIFLTRTLYKDPSFTTPPLILKKPKASTQETTVSKHPTSQYAPNIKISNTTQDTDYTPKTTKTVTRPTPQKSTTSKLQVTKVPQNANNPMPGVAVQPFNITLLMPTPKPYVKENSPWTKKKPEPLIQKLPGSKEAPRELKPLKKKKNKNAYSGEKRKRLHLPSKQHGKINESHVNSQSLTPSKQNLVQKGNIKNKKTDLKQVESLPIQKPQIAPSTEKPVYIKPASTTTPFFAVNGSRFETGDNSSIFKSFPDNDKDTMGKNRFIAPHVIYKTGKRPQEPCSITQSLSYFPDEESVDINATAPPKNPPANLTVVTVEGCSSFVILDWEKPDNETKEYEVTSFTEGPHGKEESVLTTNQTHTAVENLKPESSYQFTVTPKNELGLGPASEPVTFNTESADPRVSDIPTGKTAIWSSFPFKADSYSECNGRQFVKRTWYRKFVGIQLCNSLRYKIYLSDTLKGKFYNIGDQTGYGEDHCQFVDSFLDGRTGGPLQPHQLPPKEGYFRAVRQEPVKFGKIGGSSNINYVAWYECGVPIPGSW
ncbi:target of Nesh-SH3 [Hoplias malabaricus]|uniref:target of Nesh-SH3 n=1 Tax=Hoplias malabaricus TaxID=27720 RepID=UPI00346359D4